MAGGDPWGGGPWGGPEPSGDEDPVLEEALVLAEGLDVYVNFQLISATSLNLTLVELVFSHDLDTGYAFHTNPSNYPILPALAVTSVTYTSDPRKLHLHTEIQSPVVYTLTVGTARTVDTDLIDPNADTALFAGFDATPTFFPAAQGPRKVMLTFSQPMLQDSEFIDPTSYSIVDLDGTVIPVTAATPQGLSPISRVTLTLGADLINWRHYVATVGVTVKTTTGLNVNPSREVFQWQNMNGPVERGPIIIPFDSFSGEVSGGLHGTPAGQVFFSPALEASAPNSVIEVEEVAVCTRAYDVYSLPVIPDPTPFFTFGGGPPSVLGGANVLWAPAEVLGLARVELSDTRTDTLPASADAITAFILREPIDISIGGFLNDSRWHLYDGSPTTFMVADNSAPVGPGPTVATIFPTNNVTVTESSQRIASSVRSLSEDLTVGDAVGIQTTETASDAVLTADDVQADLL